MLHELHSDPITFGSSQECLSPVFEKSNFEFLFLISLGTGKRDERGTENRAKRPRKKFSLVQVENQRKTFRFVCGVLGENDFPLGRSISYFYKKTETSTGHIRWLFREQLSKRNLTHPAKDLSGGRTKAQICKAFLKEFHDLTSVVCAILFC